MDPINTAFTKLVDVKTPIVGAPMGYEWSAELAPAVALAGGLGMLGDSFESAQQLRITLGNIRKKLGVGPGEILPIGVGFIGWLLDKSEDTENPRLPVVLEQKPKAVYFAFGNNLARYIAYVRDYDAKREHKTLVIVCVNTVDEALRAANEWKADVIVAQGYEAGGHGSSSAPTTSILVTAILCALPNGPPVLAAGGIATGAQMASYLTLGASGVVLGTRLLFTHECGYTQTQKSILAEADLNATARSVCFDEVNRVTGWPAHLDGRAIANSIWTDHLAGLPLEERLKNHDKGVANGQRDRVVVWAGAAVGLTEEITSAAEVIAEVHKDAILHLRRVSELLGGASVQLSASQ